jgi:citrate synthase
VTGDYVRTSIGRSDRDSITVRGRDVARELMGEVPFGDFAFLLTTGRQPDADEAILFNAVLVSLAEHGLTPSAVAARLTYAGAPDSIQGAVAAGLLGGGSVLLGPVENTALFLGQILERGHKAGPGGVLRETRRVLQKAIDEGARIPGLGHPIHTVSDPRTVRLYELAEARGRLGEHLRLLRSVAAMHAELTGKTLPINGAGAAGAVLADLGFSPSTARGFALLARTAGLVAHLAEEAATPIAMDLWAELDERASRQPRNAPTPGRADD